MAEHRTREQFSLNPTAEQTFELEGSGRWNFLKRQRHAVDLQQRGEVEAACEERYQAVQALEEALPDEEEINLDWSHVNSRAALEILFSSAVDHLLIGDWELSAALMEWLLELDPEDHLGAIEQLAWLYVQMEEYELFEEVLPDLSEKSPERWILVSWAAFRRTGELPTEALAMLQGRFAPYLREWMAAEHPTDPAYLREINSDRPSHAALARDLWLRTEPFWALNGDFIEALRRQKGAK